LTITSAFKLWRGKRSTHENVGRLKPPIVIVLRIECSEIKFSNYSQNKIYSSLVVLGGI
jgi:hypothetical protein